MTNPIAKLKARAMAKPAMPAAEPTDTDRQPAVSNRQPTLGDAAPCPICGNPIHWVDVYGNPPHCGECDPPPSRSLVRSVVTVIGTPGSYEWEPWTRRGPQEHRASQPDQPEADEIVYETYSPLIGPPICPCGNFSHIRETPIHGGDSTRRDCGRCKRFIGFGRWHQPAKAG